MPPDSDDEPARWRMIEATNGYDADNAWFNDQSPRPQGPASRTRSARLKHAFANSVATLTAGQRRRHREAARVLGATSSAS